jgi:hypothetical protein
MACTSSSHHRRQLAPLPRVGGRGLALPALMDINTGGLYLQDETLKYNIHLKQMKHLGHTLATCVKHIQHLDKTIAT